MADVIDETTAEDESALNHFEWDGEGIDMAEAMYERAQAYGSYVNKDRAIPDVRDGLKPVQRRILYSMSNGQLNVTSSRPRQKCANICGHTMGNFHPHGDSAIYGALVRMAQDFSMSIPLIDKQGNFGSVGPQAYSNPPAAFRYTEARLSKIATDSLADLHPEIVKFGPNFSEQKEEPVVLPVTFPNLLVNGGMGIGWSLASNIPTHNLIEACDAAILVAENPEATLKQIMKRMPGPDFPTGAIIVDPESLVSAYETGRGTFKVQCKYKIENVPGSATQQQIVVTELPYGVSGKQIVAEIGAKAEEEKITEVAQNEWPENQSDKNGTRVVVKTKRGGNVQKLLAELLEHTSLRTSVSINMTVLIDRTPKQVNLKETLEHFVAFRLSVVRGRLELERKELYRELKRLLALIAANASVDEVVKIIKNSRDDDHTRAQLIKLLKYTPHGTKKAVPIDEEQAQWIMDMRLKRINQINVKLLKEEAKTKGDRIDEITRILESEHGVRDIVVDELKETKKTYGVPRRTFIGGEIIQEAVGTGKSAAAIVSGGPVQPVTVYIAANGNALVTERPKKQPTSSPLKTSDTTLIASFDAVSDQSVFAFTEQGMCFKVTLADCPVERSGKGRPLVGINKGDKVIAAFPCGTAPYYTFVTEKGELKRQPEEPLLASQSLGIVGMGIPNDDAVVAVVPMTDKDEIIISSANGQALRINAEKIPAKKTPSAGGVAGMKLSDGDKVVAATVASGDTLLVVHETGMAKRVKLSEYPTKGRGGGGVASAAIDKPTRGDGPAGPVVAAIALTSKDAPILFSSKGQFVDYDPKTVAEGTRAAVSKRAFDLGPGDAIRGVLVFADEGK